MPREEDNTGGDKLLAQFNGDEQGVLLGFFEDLIKKIRASRAHSAVDPLDGDQPDGGKELPAIPSPPPISPPAESPQVMIAETESPPTLSLIDHQPLVVSADTIPLGLDLPEVQALPPILVPPLNRFAAPEPKIVPPPDPAPDVPGMLPAVELPGIELPAAYVVLDVDALAGIGLPAAAVQGGSVDLDLPAELPDEGALPQESIPTPPEIPVPTLDPISVPEAGNPPQIEVDGAPGDMLVEAMPPMIIPEDPRPPEVEVVPEPGEDIEVDPAIEIPDVPVDYEDALDILDEVLDEGSRWRELVMETLQKKLDMSRHQLTMMHQLHSTAIWQRSLYYP